MTLDREFDFALAPKMKKGVSIEEGFARMEDIFRVGPRTLKVVLTQGLKRQIREMFFKFGYEVKRLVRVQIGSLALDEPAAGPASRADPGRREAVFSGRARTASRESI